MRTDDESSNTVLNSRGFPSNAVLGLKCMILLDGAVVYACTARMEAREMHLAPLPNKPLNRDLVTEIAPPGERLERLLLRG